MRLSAFLFVLLLASPHSLDGAVTKKQNGSSSAKASAKPDSEAKPELKQQGKPEEESGDEVREGPDKDANSRPPVAAVSSIEPEALADFDHYPPQIQQVIRDALALTKLNLTYTFGSADPSKGGMDCSGTIVHLLQKAGIGNVPRQSDQICHWLAERTLLHRITTARSLADAEFSALQPGDLVFWSGTYVTSAPRAVPVTHVMLYLGKHSRTGRPVLFGASDGRVYEGKRRTGVSVFDFSLPKAGGKSSIYGYGLIPGVGKVVVKPPANAAAQFALTSRETQSPTPNEKGEASSGKVVATNDGKFKVTVDSNAELASDSKEEIRKAVPAHRTPPAKDLSDANPARSRTNGKDDAATASKATADRSSTRNASAAAKKEGNGISSNASARETLPDTRAKLESAAMRLTKSIKHAASN
jgi:cell wall-associated NlpC family hydrolase